MEFDDLLKEILSMEGNYRNNTGDMFISITNITRLLYAMKKGGKIQSVLITPFLINLKTATFYELHYYEFEIEVCDISASKYVEHLKGNILPKEITDNIKPKVFIAKEDKNFFIASLQKYLDAMMKMQFIFEKKSISSLNDSVLFFQLY